jgi:hypothetical protein
VADSLSALIIEKCAQTIENTIIPALQDEVAIVQARYTAVILHALAPGVEERSKGLMEQNRDMREVLTEARKTIGNKGGRFNYVGSRLAEALGLNEGQSDILEENHRLKALLVDVIESLDSQAGEADSETIASLRGRIRNVLRRQLNGALSGLPVMQVKV